MSDKEKEISETLLKDMANDLRTEIVLYEIEIGHEKSLDGAINRLIYHYFREVYNLGRGGIIEEIRMEQSKMWEKMKK